MNDGENGMAFVAIKKAAEGYRADMVKFLREMISYATQVADLNADGTVEKLVDAHDIGCAINPLSVERQIESGVAISLGFALTADFPLENGRPKTRFGSLGLFQSHKTPKVHTIITEKPRKTRVWQRRD